MSARRERIEILLVDEVTDGLDDSGSAELEELLAEHPEIDRYAFERAAAAAFLAVGCSVQNEPMPATLKSKLAVDAEQSPGSQD